MESIGTATLPVVIDRAALNKEIDQAGQGVTSQMAGIGKKAGAILGGAAFGLTIAKGLGDTIAAGRESNKVMAQTEAVIKSTGGAARLTAEDFGILAGKISAKTGIDDEAIQSGENLLATFTNVRNEVGKGNDIFSQATGIMVDMGAALGGDASSNAILLGKALNDPIKGVAALTRVGVSFTAQQKDQIKQLVANNDLLGAQKLILAELTKEFGGSAEAQATAWDKLKVKIGNVEESIGQTLIPIIDDAATWLGDHMGGAQDRVAAGFDGLVVIGDKLRPAWDDLADAGEHLWVVIDGVWQVAEPAAEGLAKIGGASVVGGIRGAAAGLEAVTGFLADHPALIKAIGYGITTYLITSTGVWVAELAAAKGALAADLIVSGLWGIAGIIDTLAARSALFWAGFKAEFVLAGSGIESMKASFAGLGGVLSSTQVMMLGVAAAAAYGMQVFQGWTRDANNAKVAASEFTSGLKIDTTSLTSITRGLGDINDKATDLAELASKSSAARQMWENLTPAKNKTNELKEQVASLRVEAEKYQVLANNLRRNEKALSDEWGTSMKSVEDYARVLGVDLTGAFEDSGAAREKVSAGIRKLAEDADYWGPRFADALKLPADELKRRAEEADKFVQGVVSTWAHGLDVVSALGNAEQLTDTSIEFWYMAKLGQANTFKDNLQKAIADGYSPDLINRLVAAGPGEGGRLLQGLVDNASGAFVDMVNAAEKAMGEMAFRAAEIARITNIAVKHQTDDYTAELPKAMALANLIMSGDQSRTLDEMAFKLGTSVKEMQRIASDFGITIPIDADTSKANAKIDLLMQSWNQALHSLGGTATPGAINAERQGGGRSATPGGKSMSTDKGYGTTTTSVGNGYGFGSPGNAPVGGKSVTNYIYTQDDPNRIVREMEATIR